VSLIIPFSEACERNKDWIMGVLAPYFSSAQSLLEIGSGTGQHAIYFARHFPKLIWQTSDQLQHHDGLNAQLENAGVANVLPPLVLDVTESNWNNNQTNYDAIYSANTFHIMSWQAVQAFFQGLEKVVGKDALLMVYGPFKYNAEFTSQSNAVFDQSLRSRGCGSAIRDFEKVDDLAAQQGFELLQDHAMPANNQCLIWQRG